LCLALTDNPDYADVLDTLTRSNANLLQNGGEYRYHDLFLEFLRERARESGIDQNALLNAAAEYYMETNEYYKAAAYAFRSENADIDMRVIQRFFNSNKPTLDQYYELARVYDVSRMTDDYCARRPILYMPNILSAILVGDIDNARRFFDRFYAALPEFVKLRHPIADVAVTRLILDSRVKLAELPAFLDTLGLSLENKVPGQAALVTMQMPFPHRSNRDYTEFINADVRGAVRSLLDCLLGDGCECFLNSVTAGLLMEQNKLDEALSDALRAYRAMTDLTPGELYFGVSVSLAEIYSLTSDETRSLEVLERLRRWIDENKASYLLRNLAAYETRLRLWERDLSAARNWLGNYYVGGGQAGEFYRIFQDFTTARAYIALSEPETAIAVLKRLSRLGEGMDRPLDRAEAEVLTAVAEWVAGKKKEARARLRRLLADLLPYGYVRIVANEGNAVLPILAAVVKELDKTADRDESLYGFAKEIYAAAYERSKQVGGLTLGSQVKGVKLSPKQTYILELLSKGHTQAEIVKITGRSINTVREHTKAAYKKLEVNNAADAVIKARELKLIE
jgi:LuxR family maltose regulon positive regulatory protein